MATKYAGMNWTLSWSNLASTTVRIRYGIDGGTIENVIDDASENLNGPDPDNGDGYYVWEIPDALIGHSVIVRVLDATEDDIYLDTDSFSIEEFIASSGVYSYPIGCGIGCGIG